MPWTWPEPATKDDKNAVSTAKPARRADLAETRAYSGKPEAAARARYSEQPAP